MKNFFDGRFIDCLVTLAEAGMVKNTNGSYLFPLMDDNILDMPASRVSFEPREYHTLMKLDLYPTKLSERPDSYFTIGRVLNTPLDVIRKAKGCGEGTVKGIRTKIYDFIYENLSLAERELFWCDFISLNNPDLWSAVESANKYAGR